MLAALSVAAAGVCSAQLAPAPQLVPITLDPICANPEARNPRLPPGNPAPGTRRMAERMAEYLVKSDPASLAYMSDRMVEVLETQLAATSDPKERFRIQFALAIQQTQAGRPDHALNTFVAMEQAVLATESRLDTRTATELRTRKAMAYLRLGEQENCLATHNADSCIFPLGPKAVHLLPRGSRNALGLFNEQLRKSPDDLATRWLLNIAHMTLGEYPDLVPPKFLIPPSAFASEFPMPRFPDVSDGLGLDCDDLAGGVIVDDFDNDGFYDIVVSAWDLQGQLRYFHNNGDGTFAERTSEAGLVGETGSLNIQQTDYNNDGLPDIWMLRGGWLGKAGRMPNSLLRNNGDGTFTDVTEEAGLLSFHPTQTSRWFDYDGDGWLDLFIGNESTDRNDPDPCELFHNNGDGTFTECARACGINVAEFIKGVACADFDNDGRPDLYLSSRSSRGILLHNDGPGADGKWHFSDTTEKAGPLARPISSFGTFFFDYDNDGNEDLYVSGYALPNGVADVAADYLGMRNQGTPPRLYHNKGDGTFEDVTATTHLDRVLHAMGHNFGDLDNDGWLDFYLATGDPDFRTLIPNRMFRNAGGKFFQDVTTATGTGHLQKGHAVAFADLDDDGFQDIYVSLGGAFSGDGARNALFHNPGNSTNHFVKLKLVGIKANRAAIGARVKIAIATPAGPRDLHRTVGSGASFGSNPLRLEVGLADATSITAVDIRWPGSDLRQHVTGLDLDAAYEIREGQPATPVKLHPLKLGSHRVSASAAPAATGLAPKL